MRGTKDAARQPRSSKGPGDWATGARGRTSSSRRAQDRIGTTDRALDAIERYDGDDAELPEIVALAQGGDALAFADLYVRLFDRVYRYLRLALKSDHDAQEVAQDVFAKLLTILPGYDASRGPFRTWLFSVVRNMTIDHLRKSGRSDATDPDTIRTYMPSLGERVRTLQTRFDPMLDLAAIVDGLPPGQRRVIALRFIFDLTPAEIGAVVGVSADAIRHTQHRALKAIASAMRAEALGSRIRGTPLRRS